MCRAASGQSTVMKIFLPKNLAFVLTVFSRLLLCAGSVDGEDQKSREKRISLNLAGIPRPTTGTVLNVQLPV